MPPLLFRGDANATIGTGHVMRCLAMAQAWKRAGGEAVFAIGESPEALINRLIGEGFNTISCWHRQDCSSLQPEASCLFARRACGRCVLPSGGEGQTQRDLQAR
jgi:hypothetical protein